MRMRFGLIAAVPLLIATTPPDAPLEGWWRAPLQHGADSSEFFLQFERRGDTLVARFSIPAIAADRSPLGRVQVDGSKVKILEANWTLDRSADGQHLTATIPDALLPIYKIPGTFRRSEAPVQPAPAKPASPAPKPLWAANLGEPIVGGVAADESGNTIYVGTTKGSVAALVAKSGFKRWSAQLGAPVRAAPRAHGNALYVASDAALHKLDARTGRSLWSKSFGAPLHPILEISDGKSRWDHYSAAPVLAGDAVYAGSRDGCLYALAADSGAERLKTCSKGSITAAPVVAGDLAYFASFDHQLYAVRTNGGAIAWQADLKEPVTRDLALIGDMVIAGSRSYDLRAFDRRSGKVRWNRYIWFSWIDSAPAHDGRLLAIGSSDAQRIFAMDARTGAQRWSTFLGGWAWSKPAISRTHVYAGVVGTGIPYVGRRDGGLFALDRRSGRPVWSFRSQGNSEAPISGFAADPLLAGKRLIAADLAGNVYAFAAD